MFDLITISWRGRRTIAAVAERATAETIARALATADDLDGVIVEPRDDPTIPPLVYVHNLVRFPSRPEVPPAA